MVATLVPLVIAFSWIAGPQHEALLRRSDVGTFGPTSFRARLVFKEPKKGSTRQIEVWRSGESRTLVRFMDPKERGKFLLRLGDQLWFLTSGTKKPVRLNSAYRLYGGASLDAVLGLALGDNYVVERSTQRADPGGTVIVFELAAKKKKALFPQVVYEVRQANERPVRAEYRLGGGRLATSIAFLDWTQTAPLYARRVMVTDHLRNGARTEVSVVELQQRQVPDGLFDLTDGAARRALEQSDPGRLPNQ